MRFVVDCMLGKLAKWLKILGFDALFFSKIEDEELLALARKEGRTLLTRDTGLIKQATLRVTCQCPQCCTRRSEPDRVL